jgi:uncharacterized peroxidase-related enzyme
MPHITLPEGAPGIVGPMLAYPETEAPLNALAEALLRGPSSLTEGERELIATYVSARNECFFCSNIHAATARHLLGPQGARAETILGGSIPPDVGEKLQTLLVIADKVRQDGRLVTEADVAKARAAGADDKAIHDTVLIAAAFCMFNRYVDGLATWAPRDPLAYVAGGEKLATQGYLRSIR